MKKNKKSTKKQRNKRKKILALVSCLIFVVLICYVFVYGKNKIKEDKNENDLVVDKEPQQNEYDIEDVELAREIYFLEDKDGNKKISAGSTTEDKILGKYKCKNLGCGNFDYLPSPDNEHYFLDNNLVLISEWDGSDFETIVYNYQTNTLVSSYDKALCSYEFANGNFSILVLKNGKMGILSSSGKLVYDVMLDQWKNSGADNVCQKIGNYNMNGVNKYPGFDGVNGVVSKDGKYGVINLQTGKVIVDFKYDAIRLMYDGNYSIKQGNKWYLMNEKLTKLIQNGYDAIYSFGDVILVGTKDSKDIVKYKLINKQEVDLTNMVEIDFLQIDSYHDVKPGVIGVGMFGGGTFTYDLTKKTLNYK